MSVYQHPHGCKCHLGTSCSIVFANFSGPILAAPASISVEIATGVLPRLQDGENIQCSGDTIKVTPKHE